MLKRILSSLIVLSLLISALGVSAFAESEERTIAAGDVIEIATYEENRFKFVPEEDGFYEFRSDGDISDPWATINNENGEYLIGNDDRNVGDYNFSVSYEMEKGKTYYLICDVWGEDPETNYTVTFRKASLADSVEIVPIYVSSNIIGDYQTFIYECTPEGSVCPDVEWSVEDENVARVDGSDSIACAVVLIGVGKTNLVLSSKHGLSAKYEIECVLPPEIKLNEKESVSITEENRVARFSFIPEESGAYYFQTSEPSFIEIFDMKGNMVATNHIYGSGPQASSVKAYFEKGETYILSSGVDYDTMSTEYTIFVDKCIAPESVDITGNFDFTNMYPGFVYTLTAEFSPYNAYGDNCKWTVSDESLVSVEPDGDKCNVVFNGSGSVEVTVETENGITATAELSSVEIEQISLNEEKTVTIEDKPSLSVDRSFIFIPEKSGYYSFMSEGEFDTVGEIWYDSLESPYAHSDDYNAMVGDYNFAVQAYFEEGEVYILQCSSYGGIGEYTVAITETKAAEAVYLSGESNMFAGVDSFINVTYDSKASLLEEYTVYTDCEGAYEIFSEQHFGFNVRFEEAGTYNVWIETENGLVSEKFEIEVKERTFTPLENNKETEVTVFGGEYVLFEFTPEESGTYCIYSDCEAGDPWLEMVNENMENLGNDDDGGYDLNFKMIVDMEAGETYRFKVGAYQWDDLENVSFSLGVTDDTTAVDISFVIEETVYMVVGDRFDLAYRLFPIYAVDNISEVIIENEEVISLADAYEDSYSLIAVGEGEATFTIVTEGGLRASVKIVVSGEACEEPLYGDLDEDGKITPLDSNLLKKYMTGNRVEINETNADINGDSEINSIDSNYLKRIIVGSN